MKMKMENKSTVEAAGEIIHATVVTEEALSFEQAN